MAKKIDYASLYTLRKDGRYVASFVDDTGRHYIYDKDPYLLHLKLQQAKEPKEKPPLLFGDILDLWLESDYEAMPDGTKASYSAHIKRARNQFGDWIAVEITPNDILNHLMVLRDQNLTRSTMNKLLIIYRSVFAKAIVDKEFGQQIRYNPALAVKIPTPKKKAEKREAPEDEIVEKIQKEYETAYFGEFAIFLICTGMRRGEALAVQLQDINLEKDEIDVTKSVDLRSYRGKVNTPKTEAGTRHPPILDPIRPFLLRRLAEGKPTDYLFYGESDPGKPMPKSAYERKWNHYCKEMGFVKVEKVKKVNAKKKEYTVDKYHNTLTAHVLRHGYATILFECGIEEEVAQELLGHADLETTQKIYTHLRNRKKMSAVTILKQKTKERVYNLVEDPKPDDVVKYVVR